jgi:hypothetical protein
VMMTYDDDGKVSGLILISIHVICNLQYKTDFNSINQPLSLRLTSSLIFVSLLKLGVDPNQNCKLTF